MLAGLILLINFSYGSCLQFCPTFSSSFTLRAQASIYLDSEVWYILLDECHWLILYVCQHRFHSLRTASPDSSAAVFLHKLSLTVSDVH